MVDMFQVALCIIAVAIMIGVPLLCIFLYDGLVTRFDEVVAHRKDLRALRNQRGMPIERLCADLRRLRAELRNDRHPSLVA